MKKVLLVANWDWVLFNFRYALAKTLRDKGFDVVLVCPKGDYVARMQEAGFRWVDWSLQRRSLNPLQEITAVRTLADIYRQEKPHVIHHDTIKPNFYGSLAVRLNRRRSKGEFAPKVINTFMGLGYLFSNHQKAVALRRLLLPIFRFALDQPNLFTIFSNQRDRETFIKLGLLNPNKTRVLVSECVDVSIFCPAETREASSAAQPFRVLMAARLLWDKGVMEFVEAAKILRDQNQEVEFLLAGEPDKENPQWVPEEQLRAWEKEGLIQWLGHRSDMPQMLQQVNLATLPTHYNEGLPRFLVESAAAGLPLIATDIPACRAIVRDGANGFIIPRRDPQALAQAILKIKTDQSLYKRMCDASRSIALDEFDETQVLKDWLSLYNRLTLETA